MHLPELVQAAEQGEGSGGAAVEEELAQVKAEAAEQEKEFGELLACLGQESAKVAALQDLLLQRGIDASGILAQVRRSPLSWEVEPLTSVFPAFAPSRSSAMFYALLTNKIP